MWKPWPSSQFSACSRARMASFSMPSATTVRPRVWARSMVERTIIASPGARCIAITKRLSIFSWLTGRRRKQASDEQPVPKSSINNLKP